jgi:hypothetical protein
MDDSLEFLESLEPNHNSLGHRAGGECLHQAIQLLLGCLVKVVEIVSQLIQDHISLVLIVEADPTQDEFHRIRLRDKGHWGRCGVVAFVSCVVIPCFVYHVWLILCYLGAAAV